MTGNIINYGTLAFNRSDNSTYTGIISGSGNLVKSGAGDHTLTGLNTYTGSSTINDGRLILERDVPATSSSSYSGAGRLVIQPASNSFTSPVTYPIPGFTVSSSIGGLTIGKPTNTANITVTGATTAAGPITMYGGNIFVQQNLRSTFSGSPILVQASGHIELSTNDTIRTNGGAVTLNATSGGTATTNIRAIYLYSGSGIVTNGGNITLGGGYPGTEGNLYAATNYSGGGYAIVLVSSTLNAAGGDIKIYGRNVPSYGDGVFLNAVNISTTGSGTIGIYGDSFGGYNGTTYFGGITFENVASTIQTVNGNITMKGILTNSQSSQGYGINFYRSPGSAGQTRHIQILSQTGSIQITGDRGASVGSGIGHSSWGDIYFGSPLNNSYTASGNITFTYSALVNAGSNGFKVKTTGAVTYEPTVTSFDAAQTFPPTANYLLADGASSLTIGKSGNTANFTLSAAQSIAGPISLYGGTLTLNQNLSSTAGGNISLYGNTLTFASGRTVSSTGQLLVAPAAASTTIGLAGAAGTLQITSTHLSTNFADGFSNITIGSDSQTGNIGTNAFTLQDNMTFKTTGSLILGGKPLLGANDVTLGEDMGINLGSPANYFKTDGVGKVFRQVGNGVASSFPIGNTAYNPVTITNNSGTSDLFSARVFDAVYLNGTSGAALTTPRVNATWDIDKQTANAGSGIDFDFTWNTGQETGGTISQYQLNHFKNSAWETAVGTASAVTVGTDSKSMTHSSYTGTFSPFYIGSGSVNPLPVTLLSFDVSCEAGKPYFTWITVSEINNSHFDLEQSADLISWGKVARIEGNGNSNQPISYAYTLEDFRPSLGRYFRLHQYDYNGDSEAHFSVYLDEECQGAAGLVSVFPNPADGPFTVSGAGAGSEWQLMDASGRLLDSRKADSAGNIVFANELPDGMYFLRSVLQGETILKKIVIRRMD
jgi:autotransporter-associated beta strand protein